MNNNQTTPNGDLCIITGRVGNDPSDFLSEKGTLIVTLSLALDSDKPKYTRINGQYKKVANWIDVKFFNNAASFVLDTVKTGDKVQVTGQFRTREWIDRDGDKRTRTEFVGKYLDMVQLSKRREGQPLPINADQRDMLDAVLAAINGTDEIDLGPVLRP